MSYLYHSPYNNAPECFLCGFTYSAIKAARGVREGRKELEQKRKKPAANTKGKEENKEKEEGKGEREPRKSKESEVCSVCMCV